MIETYKYLKNTRIRKYGEDFYIIGEETVLKTNEMGAIIYKYIGKNTTNKELSKKIVNVFTDISEEDVEFDTQEFIKVLETHKLIVKKVDNE